jgi:hypothetical protein
VADTSDEGPLSRMSRCILYGRHGRTRRIPDIRFLLLRTFKLTRARLGWAWAGIGGDDTSRANEKTSVKIGGRDGDDQHHDENATDNKAAVDQRADGNARFAQWEQIVG